MSLKFLPRIIEAAPTNLAKLKFQSHIDIEPGKEISRDLLIFPPDVCWTADKNGLYTLILVNSDTVSNRSNKNTHICHWMIINIPGNCLNGGKVLIPYNAPTIDKSCEMQTFLILIFKQADVITTDNFVFKISKEGRIVVKTSDYRTKYHLGDLVAGNYYRVK